MINTIALVRGYIHSASVGFITPFRFVMLSCPSTLVHCSHYTGAHLYTRKGILHEKQFIKDRIFFSECYDKSGAQKFLSISLPLWNKMQGSNNEVLMHPVKQGMHVCKVYFCINFCMLYLAILNYSTTERRARLI